MDPPTSGDALIREPTSPQLQIKRPFSLGRKHKYPLLAAARAVRGNNVDERQFDTLVHAFGVAAHVNVGTVGKLRPDVATGLAHAILYIDLLIEVAPPSQRQSSQIPISLHILEFVVAEDVCCRALMAEEQPVAIGR